MNIRHLALCALAIAPRVHLPTLHAASPVIALARESDLQTSAGLLPIGTARATIAQQVGPPDSQLSADVWVYWNRRTNQPHRAQGLDTLLVIFRHDRVAEFRMVPEAPVRRFLAELHRRDPAALLRGSQFVKRQ